MTRLSDTIKGYKGFDLADAVARVRAGGNVPQNQDANWEKCKTYLGTLSVDFREVAVEKASKDPFAVDVFEARGRRFITVDMGRLVGFEVQLKISEDEDGVVKYAYYVAYNNQKNVVYKRDLI